MIAPVLALGGALALELAGAWQLAMVLAGGAVPWLFAVLHLAGSVLAAGILLRLLPGQYQDDPRAGFLFLFLVAVAVPVLGVAGLALGLLPALWRQRHPSQERDLIRCALARELAASAIGERTQDPPADGSLMGALLGAPAREHRLRALIATLGLDVRQALPLLRIGLRDPDDDVRLLSYALLSRKEKALETRVADILRQIERVPEAERFSLHRALARDYAELAELAQDATAVAFLSGQARTHAQAAASIRPREADVQFLLGRMLLKGRDLEAARSAFLRAVAAGVALDKVALFLAEIAFHQQQLDQVGHLVRVHKRQSPPPLAVRLDAYWGARHER